MTKIHALLASALLFAIATAPAALADTTGKKVVLSTQENVTPPLLTGPVLPLVTVGVVAAVALSSISSSSGSHGSNLD